MVPHIVSLLSFNTISIHLFQKCTKKIVKSLQFLFPSAGRQKPHKKTNHTSRCGSSHGLGASLNEYCRSSLSDSSPPFLQLGCPSTVNLECWLFDVISQHYQYTLFSKARKVFCIFFIIFTIPSAGRQKPRNKKNLPCGRLFSVRLSSLLGRHSGRCEPFWSRLP